MYTRFVSLVPLVHPSDIPADKPEFVYIIPDWTAQVMDRIWAFMCNIPPVRKGLGLDYLLGKNFLLRFLDMFVQQMSPTLHGELLSKVSQKVSATYYPPAKKFFGNILNAVALASPGTSLKALIPLLVGKVLKPGTGDGFLGSDSETAYWVHLLGHVVARTGEGFLPFRSTLESVVDRTVFHDDKELRKQGQKLLRKLLRALLQAVPCTTRSLPPARWAGLTTCRDFSQLVHPAFVSQEAGISVSLPGPLAQASARELVDKYMSLAMSKVAPPGGAASTQSDLRAGLRCMEAVVRGGAGVFPEARAAFSDLQSTLPGLDLDDQEGLVGLPVPWVPDNAGWAVDVRCRLAACLLGLCSTHALRENADVATLKALLRVLQTFLSHNGFTHVHDSVNHGKAIFRLWGQGMPATYTRFMATEKAQALLSQRLAAGVWAMSAGAEKLLGHVLGLCMHEYSAVRKKAQKCLPKVLVRHPRFADQALSAALATLARPDSTKGTVNGAVYTVNTGAMLARLARQWGHTSDLVLGLLASHHFADTKVQVRLAELWNAFVPYSTNLQFMDTAAATGGSLLQLDAVRAHFSHDAAVAAIAEGVAARQRARALQEATYDKAIAVVESRLAGGGLHWRFTLLAAASMSLLLRHTRIPSRAVLDSYVQGLANEVLPLRHLCRAVLPSVVSRYRRAAALAGSTSTACPMEMEGRAVIAFEELDAPLEVAFWEGPVVDCVWRAWSVPAEPTVRPSINAHTITPHAHTHTYRLARSLVLCVSSIAWKRQC